MTQYYEIHVKKRNEAYKLEAGWDWGGGREGRQEGAWVSSFLQAEVIHVFCSLKTGLLNQAVPCYIKGGLSMPTADFNCGTLQLFFQREGSW